MARQRPQRPVCLVSIHRSVLIAYGEGLLDLAWLTELRRQLDQLLPQGRFRGVIVSLQHVKNTTSRVFDPLHTLSGELRDQGITLVVCEQSAYVQQLFDFGGVGKKVITAPSVAEAMLQVKWQSHLIARVS